MNCSDGHYRSKVLGLVLGGIQTLLEEPRETIVPPHDEHERRIDAFPQ